MDKDEEKVETEKKSNNFNIVVTIIQIISIILIFYSGIEIYNWYKENKENARIKEELKNVITEINTEEVKPTKISEEKSLNANEFEIDFEELKKINSDTVGWLKVNNTQIEYSVVKGRNNDYYLTHSFNKSNNSAGWIFADYRNKIDGTDRNIIIYGHNRADKSMFGTMQDIIKEEWYNNENNKTIVFITQQGKYNYEIFSIYVVKDESYFMQTNFTDESFKKFIQTVKNRSIKDFEVEVDENDKILTLATCYGNDKYRVVLHAKADVTN